ncbi:unnamed protein product [Brachionus calyciflorus]|uniref:Uncharacterized protein n=1 Tax=Brachionus calyciflorus TaxID=104777 RepID=A0A814MHE3_9BILA|nr:unnamed protein product [Brachionus calyciflorus]
MTNDANLLYNTANKTFQANIAIDTSSTLNPSTIFENIQNERLLNNEETLATCSKLIDRDPNSPKTPNIKSQTKDKIFTPDPNTIMDLYQDDSVIIFKFSFLNRILKL